MLAIAFVAVLLAAPTGGADRDQTPRPESALFLQLVWCDPAHMLPERFDEMAREVRSIFRTLAVDVTWLPAGDHPTSGAEIRVILLPADPAATLHPRTAMGLVEHSQHTAFWIFAGRVRQTIGLDASAAMRATLQDHRDYPRALGRVVAHEIVHAIVPGESHADQGLMQATLNRSALTGQHLAIDNRCARAFVRELEARSAAQRAALGTPDPTARVGVATY